MSAEPLHYDFSRLAPAERYKLVTGVVVPRPVAWISTLNPSGSVNLAPYSFFNAMGSDPALVVFSPGDRPQGAPKDTARNIGAGGEFVVNLVSHALAAHMNLTATDFPPECSEAQHLHLELAPSRVVAGPRVALSPVSLECREHQTLCIGRTRLIVGEVLGLSIAAQHMQDAAKQYVNTPSLDLIGRMGGRGGYTTTRDTFELERLTYAQWLAQQTP